MENTDNEQKNTTEQVENEQQEDTIMTTYEALCSEPSVDPNKVFDGLLRMAREQNLSDEQGITNARALIGAVRLLNYALRYAPL